MIVNVNAYSCMMAGLWLAQAVVRLPHAGFLQMYAFYIVLDLRSLIWSFGDSCTIVHGIISQPMCSQMCPIDISADLHRLAEI